MNLDTSRGRMQVMKRLVALKVQNGFKPGEPFTTTAYKRLNNAWRIDKYACVRNAREIVKQVIWEMSQKEKTMRTKETVVVVSRPSAHTFDDCRVGEIIVSQFDPTLAYIKTGATAARRIGSDVDAYFARSAKVIVPTSVKIEVTL